MKALSARRPVHKIQWSSQMREFLGDTLDDFSPEKERNLEKIPATSRTTSSIRHETDYSIKKRALNSSIQRRLSEGKKQINLQAKNEEKQLIRSFKAPEKKHTKAFKKRFHDDHVIERVIDSRNEEYLATAEMMPNGRVADLRKARQLPPDRTAFVKSEHRVFYWG